MDISKYLSKRYVQVGDIVMLYETPKKIFSVKMTKGERFHNKYGHYHHDDIIGCEYGTKVYPRGHTHGWLVALRFSPQLWTISLKQRTQILYTPDISMILQGLCINPGTIVVEAGTGSGSLSMALINSIRPTGHLYTFEFNIDRVNDAQKDFISNRMSEFVTLQHRDVCKRGLPNIAGGVDAIFLDLPTPWIVIDSACQILRPGGRICCFSPCLEQVQRNCLSLHKMNFNNIRTIECLERRHEAITETLTRPQLSGYKIKWDEEARNIKPTKANKRRKSVANNQGKKCILEQDNMFKELFANEEQDSKIANGDGKKKQKTSQENKHKQQSQVKSKSFLSCKPHLMMRGHTGYLTFAVNATNKQ